MDADMQHDEKLLPRMPRIRKRSLIPTLRRTTRMG
jgi:hypothetical protein